MIASSKADGRLPPDAEARITAFTELVATAISNSEARTQLGQLADEQAALRRVATLVVRGVPASEIFRAVTEEVGKLLQADLAGMIRTSPMAPRVPWRPGPRWVSTRPSPIAGRPRKATRRR
jgi:hypothetical protein